MSLLTENKRIKSIFTDYENGKMECAKKHVRAATKLELVQLLVNPHQYSEANHQTFDINARYDFENFILNALR